MKKLFIVLVLTLQTQVPMLMGEPLIEEKYNVYDGENVFYLKMRVSEVYRILGNPDEVRTVRNPDPYHDFNIITLSYSGIRFVYFDFYDDPDILEIILTGMGKEYQIGKLKVTSFNSESILEEYCNPKYITPLNGYVYYNYELKPYGYTFEHIELQFRLNTNGICDEVWITHSGYYV